MKKSFAQCLKKNLIDHYGFKHVTIIGIYQNRILEFIGYKECGEEFKGIAELHLQKKRIIVKGYSLSPYFPLVFKKEQSYSFVYSEESSNPS